MTYTEGVDIAADDPRAIPHAWNVDNNGEVVDLTTLERESYYGVRVPTPVYLAIVGGDRIARPVLPTLLDAGWTPAMPARVALARLARATNRA